MKISKGGGFFLYQEENNNLIINKWVDLQLDWLAWAYSVMLFGYRFCSDGQIRSQEFFIGFTH